MHRWLFKSVDASSIAIFRIGFGAILFFESINYGVFLCLECLYHSTPLLFKYQYFEWAHALPPLGLRILWLLLAVAALCIMLGYYYRVAMAVFTLGFIYFFLLDQALYLNHFYMVILFCVLMNFVPAHRYWSLDARRKPALKSDLVPSWSRFLLGAQLEVILIYAGLVKLNADWLNLEPMRYWMNARSQKHGEFLQFMTQDWGIALASYGVIALHLIGAPLLLWRKTRLYALACYAVFHIINAFVFDIGIFPWFTLFASLLLFDHHWPKQLWSFMRLHSQRLREKFRTEPVRYEPEFPKKSATARQRVVVGLIAVWLSLQVLVPLRHFWLPGEVAWNEAGHRFSWRMMLRAKWGRATFVVDSGSGEEWRVDPVRHLTPAQAHKMMCIPDMIWQFAQHLAAQKRSEGFRHVQVTADIFCSLNDRELARMVDPAVNLAGITRSEPVENWVLPLDKPLRNPLWPG